MILNNVSEKIGEARDADSSILLMSRVTTPDAASFISELGNSDEKSDDEDEKKEDNLTLSQYNAKQKKSRNEDREAGGDDSNDDGTDDEALEVYTVGIGDIEIFHIEARLLACAKLDGHVLSAVDYQWLGFGKQTNVSRMWSIVNSLPNKKIRKRVEGIKCRPKHRVPIPACIKLIDRRVIYEVPAYVEYYELVKVEIIAWKKGGVTRLKKKQQTRHSCNSSFAN